MADVSDDMACPFYFILNYVNLNSRMWLVATVLDTASLDSQGRGGEEDSGPTESLYGEEREAQSRERTCSGAYNIICFGASAGSGVGKHHRNILSWKGNFPSFDHPGLAVRESMHSWKSQHFSANWLPAVFSALMH